jgi:Mn2+/Fe2+ NRAMP family transporter
LGLLVLAALTATPQAAPLADLTPAQLTRTAQIGAQISLFLGIGALTSAFSASVAATVGGLRRDEMHKLFRVRS